MMQGDARHRLLAAAQQRDAARLFAGGAGHDVDAALQDVFRVFQDDVPFAAAEDLAEELLEVRADGFERFGEHPPALAVDAADDVFQRGFRFDEVLQLGASVGSVARGRRGRGGCRCRRCPSS